MRLDLNFEPNTLVDILRRRAAIQGEKLAYTFLTNGETEAVTLTYRQLDKQARAVAARLQTQITVGQRVLLLCPSGLQYITAFLGCLYAGVVAVPAYPPRLNKPTPRLKTIVKNSRPAVAITTTEILANLKKRLERVPELESLPWIAIENISPDLAQQWQAAAVDKDTPAFLQFTSGSTTMPRGVILTHRNLLHNSRFIQQSFDTSPSSRVVSWLPMYHDMGLIGGVLQTIYCGGSTTLLAPIAFLQRPIRWLKAISQSQATISGAPNFAYDLCTQKITAKQRETLDLSSWKVAFNGAEPVRAKTIKKFSDIFADCGFRPEAFFPCYGLAEATLLVAAGKKTGLPVIRDFQKSALQQQNIAELANTTQDSQTLVSCGHFISDGDMIIVDIKTGSICQPGQIGEIWLSSPSVAQGYWNRPKENECTFEAYLPTSGKGPFLRTGDLGFIHENELFITGRLKDLIIIRGRNYYPQDIEFVVEGCHTALKPGGGAAVGVDIDDTERLVIVHELKRRYLRSLNPEEVVKAIREAIFDQYELQTYGIVLIKPGAIPRTSSGKIQRYACRTGFLESTLPAVHQWFQSSKIKDEAQQNTPGMPPQTPVEAILAKIWADVFNLDHVSIHDDFFALGGHSLLATQIISRIQQDTQLELPLRVLLESSTISKLANQIESMQQDRLKDDQLSIKSRPRPERLPLSFSQERMWFVHQFDPEGAAYNIPIALRLNGSLDIPALEQSLKAIIQRHEALRTLFPVIDGQPVQVIEPHLPFDLTVIDLCAHSGSEQEAKINEYLTMEATTPFDLSQGPLLRALLLQLDADEHILSITMHHIVSDIWSLSVFGQELITFHRTFIEGKRPALPALPIQYADYALWQREWLKTGALDTHRAYWLEQLENLPILELPIDRSRPATQTFRGSLQRLPLSPAILESLKTLGRQEQVTSFMMLLTVFKVFLRRYTGQTDIAVGTPIANRTLAETHSLIGAFVNTLVLRTDLSGDPTFRELLGRVRETTLEAYQHQDYPFEKLVELLQPERDTSRAPLIQVLFNGANTPFAFPQHKDLEIELVIFDRLAAQFDLAVSINTDIMPQVALEYNTDLFDDSTISRMLGHFQTLLTAAIANPEQHLSELPLLTETERQQLLVEWNDTAAEYPRDKCVHHLFEAQAERTPEAVAVVFEEQTLTFRQLNERANDLAIYLQNLGVGPGVRVGVYLERSLEMVLGLLGILKAGGAYLPLDPAFPIDRLAYMVSNSQTKILLTASPLIRGLAEVDPQTDIRFICLDTDWSAIADTSRGQQPNVISRVSPANLAYVIYTSGSTGKPKGVQISHQNVVNFLKSMEHEPGLSSEDILLSVTTLSFDISVLEIFLPLITGSQLVLVSRETAYDGQQLSKQLACSGATVMQATPATWRMLIECGWQGQPRLKVLCGGEALPPDLAVQLLERVDELWNMYGPTETTIWSTLCQIKSTTDKITVGRPIDNTQIYILDETLQPVPVSTIGELYIGGDGVGCGYLSRPALTAEKFIPDPFSVQPGARLYRTGDQARYLADGRIEFLGRLDHQVKIRGFRIELGEIEAILNQHLGVRQGVVIVREDTPGDKRLVAYIVPETTAPELTVDELRRFLKNILPEYMAPSLFVFMTNFPLTPNKKINRKALPVPDRIRPDMEKAFISARNPTEARLTKIWAKALRLEKIGVHDNFFHLGGHSLIATQIISQMREQFDMEIPLRLIFQTPTIAELGEFIEAAGWTTPKNQLQNKSPNQVFEELKL